MRIAQRCKKHSEVEIGMIYKSILVTGRLTPWFNGLVDVKYRIFRYFKVVSLADRSHVFWCWESLMLV